MIKKSDQNNQKYHYPKIALVIGWSGINSKYNQVVLGILNEVQKAGIRIKSVVGSGGGSFISALWALGYDIAKIQELNGKLLIPETKFKTKYFLLLKQLLPSIFKVDSHFHLRDDKLINDCIKDIFSDYTFEEAKIPFCIPTIDYLTGEQVIISSGSISEAVRVSLAQPLLYKPFPIEERLLVDGSLTEPLPVGVAIQNKTDIILAISFETKHRKANDSLSNFIINLTGILSSNSLEATLSFYNLVHDKELIAIVPDIPNKIKDSSTSYDKELYEFGSNEASKHIPYIQKLIAEWVKRC